MYTTYVPAMPAVIRFPVKLWLYISPGDVCLRRCKRTHSASSIAIILAVSNPGNIVDERKGYDRGEKAMKGRS